MGALTPFSPFTNHIAPVDQAYAAAGTGVIYALWTTIQSLFQESVTDNIQSTPQLAHSNSEGNPSIPLIQRLYSAPSSVVGISSPHILYSTDRRPIYETRYETRYDLCKGMKDGDWESMMEEPKNIVEMQDMRHYIWFNEPCQGIKSRLMAAANTELNKIAKELGSKENNMLSIELKENLTPDTIQDSSTQLNLGKIDVMALAGLEYEKGKLKQQVSGSVAYEIARRLLEHGKKLQAASPEDKNELSVKFVKEADLFTLKTPYLARGLLDSLGRQVSVAKDIWDGFKHKPVPYEVWDEVNAARENLVDSIRTDGNPSLTSRYNHLLEAVCDKYPKENRDICPIRI